MASYEAGCSRHKNMTLERDVPLARFTSLHTGGPAKFFVRAKTDADVREAVEFAGENGVPFFILGGGSNTLFPDDGYGGVVIHMEDRTLHVEGETVTAASGVFMRQLVTRALAHGLRGLENLAGIPGTVGGAVRGNAGTWGTETGDQLVSVDVQQPSAAGWKVVSLAAAHLSFGYRHSIFKEQRDWIILRAVFRLLPGDQAAGQALVQADWQRRHERQPYNAPSAGSIFKNPDPQHDVHAGALIESAGLKGTTSGGAEISPKHANFIVNRGQATSSDIRELIRLVQDTVQQHSGVKLEPEIEIIEPR